MIIKTKRLVLRFIKRGFDFIIEKDKKIIGAVGLHGISGHKCGFGYCFGDTGTPLKQ